MSVLPASNLPQHGATSPRYRGASGAIVVGLFYLGLMILLAIVAGGVVWLLTGAFAPALHVVSRLGLFGIATGGTVFLSRWICGGQSNGLMSLRIVKGESFGSIGLLAGLMVAGGVAVLLPSSDQTGQGQLAPGQVIEIAGPTLDGGRFDLASYRGKVVLVDFWATWCGPCIAELPNVRAVYDKYHGEGFEVVAISLDFDRAHLVKFLDSHPEPWPQVFFDEDGKRGWDNPLARRYGVQGIPCLLVIDRDGKLVAGNVRGMQIETTVAESLGRPLSWGDRVAATGMRLAGWLIIGLLVSPWWLLLLCGLGGAVALAFVESVLRRALQRPANGAALAAAREAASPTVPDSGQSG
jgi:thiol-disulfide isomerase/thioredoxin